MRYWRSRSTFGFILVAVLFIMGVTAFAQEEPRFGGTLIMAIPSDPSNLNPGLSTDAATHLVASKVFDGLVQALPGWQPVPNLASSWIISDDGLTYTFTLERNVRWHDGAPFTSADVVFSFEEVLGKYHSTGVGLMSDTVDYIEAPDEYTVVFHLQHVYPPFLSMLVTNTAAILPKHIYEGSDIPNHPRNFENPIGTGPFRLVEWQRGERLVLERNPDYFREGKPYLDQVILQIIPDAASRVIAFQRGDIDLLDQYVLPVQFIDQLIGQAGVQHVMRQTSGLHIMFFNLREGPMSDRAFRWAVAHAIDREFIVNQAMFGVGNIADGPFSSEVAWAKHPNPPTYDFDVDLANRMLDEAGYPRDASGIRVRLRLAYEGNFLASANTAPVLREQLRQVGIEVELVPMERSVMVDQVFQQWDFDLYMHTYAGFQDPSLGVERAYVCHNIRPAAFTNVSGYCDERVDALFLLARTTVDLEERGRYYQEATEYIIDAMPMVWLFEGVQVSVASDDYAGLWHGQVTGEYMFEDIWWKGGSVTR